MLHTLRFSLQNAVYFIMLPFFWFLYYSHFTYINVKLRCETVKQVGHYDVTSLRLQMMRKKQFVSFALVAYVIPSVEFICNNLTK